MHAPETDNNAWHQQPTVWLVLGILAFTFIASISMLIVSIRNRPDMSVSDYTRIAEISAQHVAQNERAGELGLAVVLNFEPLPDGALKVTAQLSSPVEQVFPPQLRVHAQHIALTNQDAGTELRGDNGNYTGQIKLARGVYDLSVTDPQASWRLTGRITEPVAEVKLRASGASG